MTNKRAHKDIKDAIEDDELLVPLMGRSRDKRLAINELYTKILNWSRDLKAVSDDKLSKVLGPVGELDETSSHFLQVHSKLQVLERMLDSSGRYLTRYGLFLCETILKECEERLYDEEESEDEHDS